MRKFTRIPLDVGEEISVGSQAKDSEIDTHTMCFPCVTIVPLRPSQLTQFAPEASCLALASTLRPPPLLPTADSFLVLPHLPKAR